MIKPITLMVSAVAEVANDTAPWYLQDFVAAFASGAVIAAIVTGIVQVYVTRRSASISQRRNTSVEENELVLRYKEAAAEERAQKESSIAIAERTLSQYQGQVDTLTSIVNSLNHTLEILHDNATVTKDIIQELVADRDKLEKALLDAQAQVAEQSQELVRMQQKIIQLTNSEGGLDTGQILL